MRRILRGLDGVRHRARLRRGLEKDAIGARGEDLAHRYLEDQSYRIVLRNFRTATGSAEADLIAEEGGEVVIIEVKTRETDEFSPPERAISETKRYAMARAGLEYARAAKVDPERLRFEAVAVVLSEPVEIRHYADLFRVAVD